MLQYQLKKSNRRKTVAIKVHNQEVTVYAPYFVADKELNRWVLEKKPWIDAQLQKQGNAADTKQYPYKQRKIKIYDKFVAINYQPAYVSSIKEDDEEILLTYSSRVKKHKKNYESLLKSYLEEKLVAYIELRIAQYCSKMDERLPEKLKIAVYKRKWGSCNTKRELTFNLHLIGAPTDVIDYVIVHELAHLKHLNHSQAFWRRVALFCPNYKKASEWLKHHGMSLQWVFE